MRQLIFVGQDELPSQEVFGRDLAPRDYRRYLGQTRTQLFWDASGGLYPNAFAALAATLADNCALYLHLPEHYPQGDPDHHRLSDYAAPLTDCRDYFNCRLRRIARTGAVICAQTLPDDPIIHRETPQIYLGKRGRGKTTRLAGKICWLEARYPGATLLVVTPYRSNLQQLSALLPENRQRIFLPPDDALFRKPQAAHLIVDEASAVTPGQLLALTEYYPAYTLAATEDGYEGTAREFTLHTLPQLLAQSPKAEIIYHRRAKRYCDGDRLESITENAFLLSAEAPAPPLPDTVRSVCRQEIAANERLLRNIYALLHQAHYRTTPEDLKRLLDLPQQTLIIAEQSGQVAGVAHILHETPLSPELCQEVIKGKRRPQGRLLLQQLLHKTGNACFNRPLNRISRIAVHPEQRRRGIATALIEYARNILPDPIGVIYGHQENIAAFWQALQFREYYRAPLNLQQNRPTSLRLYLPGG